MFNENTPNNVGSRPNLLFDINALTKTMNYQLVVAQSNDFSGTKASNGTGKEKEPERDYILLPLWTADLPFSTTSKSSQDNEFQPLNDDINDASSSRVNVVGTNISIDLPPDPNIPSLEDISIFEDSHDDEDVFGAKADFHNLDSTFQVSHILTTRIYKDHPLEQVIGDLHLTPQTRRMKKNLEEHGLVEEEVYVFQPHGFEDPDFLDKVYKVKKVKQKKEGIFISQDKYVAEILKKFRFLDVKKASTPMETSKPLLKDEDREEVDVHLYRSMIGSLMYLTSSRPDITFDTVVANSTTEAEYVPASSCCGQVLWIQNQLLDYG
nr:hypothetical protein [Tanacetum cinerariifolium]